VWHWAATFPKERRARRSVTATIGLLLDNSRHRLGDIPDAVWSDRYIIGLMMMLITIIARGETEQINDEALCHIQAKAWHDITGRSNDIGEEVLLLSAANDQDFERGCRSGMDFGSFLVNNPALLSHEWSRVYGAMLAGERIGNSHPERQDIFSAWEKYFDTCIGSIHHLPGRI